MYNYVFFINQTLKQKCLSVLSLVLNIKLQYYYHVYTKHLYRRDVKKSTHLIVQWWIMKWVNLPKQSAMCCNCWCSILVAFLPLYRDSRLFSISTVFLPSILDMSGCAAFLPRFYCTYASNAELSAAVVDRSTFIIKSYY